MQPTGMANNAIRLIRKIMKSGKHNWSTWKKRSEK